MNSGLSDTPGSRPFYSIVIPTYNSGKTLNACLNNILSQTNPDFEILLMDGVSTDQTIEIANAYNDNRIKICSEKDKGIYDAMNKGIERANGEWIYFLGSDDYFLNDTVLENLTRSINLDECDFVYGNVLSPEYGEKYDGEFDQQKIIEKNICHQALFVRRKLLQSMGSFNIRYKLLADYDFNLRCMFNKKVRKKHVDLVIAYYAPAGSSSTITDEAFIKDKNWLLLKYGFTSFSWRQRIQLCRQLIREVFAAGKK